MANKRRKRECLVAARIPRDMLDALDRTVEENDGSRSREIRLALRKHLSLTGKPSTRQGISEPGARR